MGTVGRLDPFFQNIIDYTMYQERQPLERLTQQKDSFNVQKNLYAGLQTRLKELQNLAQALISTDAFYAVKEGRSSSITPFGDKAILSASTSSSTPIGDYAVHVNSLATAHRVSGSQSLQSSMDMAEGISGTFILGGEASASATHATPIENATVVDFTSFTDEVGDKLVTGQKQLGSGNYQVQVRIDETAGYQFRLVDSYGQAVSIQSGDDEDTFTSSWQSVTNGVYNTGRGLKINLSVANQAEGAANVTWQSKGASIIALETDSLIAIANKINAATYADGDGVSASIVNKRLVLSARSTGVDHTIKSIDVDVPLDVDANHALVKLGIKDILGGYTAYSTGTETEATDAELTVNGSETITRSKNTGLTDVISGITLNLTGKHTGADDVDTLSVTANMEGPKTALNSFLTKFNEAVMFLDENTSVTKIADGQYTRGGLAEDTIFSDLRSQLFTAFSDQYTDSGGSYESMYEIGLSLDHNLNATISDSTKLENALNNNLDSVKSLLDKVMGAVDSQLGRFTGDNPLKQSGYINNAIQGFDGQIFQIGIDTKDMNVRLDTKQASLVAQYAEMQTQLLNLQYMQQTWSSIYGGMKSFF